MGWRTVLLFFALFDCSWSVEPINDASRFCKSYVECAAVTLLEERLCSGNTRKRPYWLPERNDPNKCHEILKNDYKTIEKMEIDLDNAFLACLTENAQPLSSDQKGKCTTSIIFNTPRFSYGRTISYIPTNCFTGIDRRRERECSEVRDCCGTYTRCAPLLSNSTLSKNLEEGRIAMRQRAADCQAGKKTSLLPPPLIIAASSDEESSWVPSGHVNVNFNNIQDLTKQSRKQSNSDEFGNVNVRFTTATAEQNAEAQAKKVLLRNGDPLSEKGRPSLQFPIPTNIDEHDKKFEQALGKTNKYKDIAADIANRGLDSLMEAASVTQVGTPSGTVRHVEMIGESENEMALLEGNVVTSRPLILVAKEQKKEEAVSEVKSEGCRAYGTKTAKIEKILGALGEQENSSDMQEIRALIHDWHQNFRKRLLVAKKRSKDKQIMEELEKLVKHFDDVNLKLIKTQAEAEFNPIDYPIEDAEITGNECDPLPSKDKDEKKKSIPLQIDNEDERSKQAKELLDLVAENEEKEANSTTTLVDEHGDELLIEDGVAKILFPSNPTIDNNEDVSSEQKITNWINEEYRQEMERFHKERFSNTTESSIRNDTTCDAYMRCRSQMHLAVDGCAWRFAAADVLSSLAESSESLLFRDEGPCDPKQKPLYEQLYEMLIKRNTKLRNCLDRRNSEFFSSSICLPYSEEEGRVFDAAVKRVLKNEYLEAVQCYHDANRIQEKCMKLRECCPNFDECREETIDIDLERTIISATARINEGKQECIRDKARDAFKKTIRGLLSKGGLKRLQKAQLGLDISRGARLIRAKK